MATVFRASRINGLGGQVAVKILAPCFARTVIARRFEREAQIVSRLSSPHIVRIYEYDKFDLPNTPASLYYIAMELIEGQTLGDLLKSQGKVNFLWAIDTLRQLARGLEEAHAQGVVHRDLKPSNVMLIQQRGHTHVKILDFGIASLTERDDAQEKLTQTGIVSGTPDYMAPEQAVGDPVGPPADIYALGLIAFEMLAGRRPFEGNAMTALMVRVTTEAPQLRSAIDDPAFPPDLCRIVDRMLDREPGRRYAHAGALLDDLGRFPTLQTTPEFVPPAELMSALATVSQPALRPPPERPTAPPAAAPSLPPRKRSTPWWAALLAFIAIAAVALVIALMTRPDRKPEATPQEAVPPAPTVNTPPLVKGFDGPRPPLDGGFSESVIPLGDTAIGLALPTEPAPLYRPLPLLVTWTRSGRPVAPASGSIKLLLDGRVIGSHTGTVRPGDGRVLLDIPPRPIEGTFGLELTLAPVDAQADSVRHLNLIYDSASQSLRPGP